MKNRILGGIAALALSVSGLTVATAAPAEATIATFCNAHHSLLAARTHQDINVYVEGSPDYTTTSARQSFALGYLRCRVPGVGMRLQTRYIGPCYKHTGLLPSFVLQGIKSDTRVWNSHGTMNEVDDFFLPVHPPVFKGNEYCDAKFFTSRKWVTRSSLPRFRVNYWTVTDNHVDGHHETSIIFLDPARDDVLLP